MEQLQTILTYAPDFIFVMSTHLMLYLLGIMHERYEGKDLYITAKIGKKRQPS